MTEEQIKRRARNRRDVRTLCLLILACACFLAAMAAIPVTHSFLRVEGAVGVVLGLYVCAHPARHFIDLLLYRTIEGERFAAARAMAGWLALNAAAMAGGWIVIVIGVMRLTAGSR